MSTLSQFTGGGIKSVQRGTILISGVANATATITSVNINKSMVSFLGFAESTFFTDNRAVPYIALTNATTVTAIRSSSSGATVVSYEVIEFY